MSAIELLESGWIDINDAPKKLFKCIVMFRQTFSHNKPMLGIGWMYEGIFKADDAAFFSLTPVKFIPLYNDNTHA